MSKDEDKARKAVRKLAERSKHEDIPKVDAQFGKKLAALEKEGNAPQSMLEQLRTMWAMLKAPDEVVPFKSKAWIMAALTYFVSPLDLIPDPLGGAGYLDDAMVVRIVHNRLADEIAAFEKHDK